MADITTMPGSVDLLMLQEVLEYLHNWFFRTDWIYQGEYAITNGEFSGISDLLQHGQYYRIVGSVFNDGLHQYENLTDTLIEESFYGAVWGLAIPQVIIRLTGEISAWQGKNADKVTGLYTSESFGGYSYTKASAGGTDAAINSWKDVFRGRLAPWRKL